MLEMASEFDKRFKYVENDVYIWKMAQVFEKRLNMWEMTYICGKCLKYMGNCLSI